MSMFAFDARSEDKTKIVFVAGGQSHGWGAHEHRAGCMLLAEQLNKNMPNVNAAVVTTDGWPEDNSIFEGVATVVIFADGYWDDDFYPHPLKSNEAFFDQLARKGVGLVTIHWATEVKPDSELADRFLEWQGGYCAEDLSVNPHWDANFVTLPDHPITRGAKPFELNDEWYYHMRFVDGLKGVTPILSAVAPASSLSRPDGPRTGNPHVRESVAKGEKQHVAWAYERPGGGRGFGFTGAHVHDNWAQDDFRTIMLNAICWTANIEVPEGGVLSATPTRDELDANQDEPKPDSGKGGKGGDSLNEMSKEEIIEAMKAKGMSDEEIKQWLMNSR
jgi:type 1 glutamine amidotransferase